MRILTILAAFLFTFAGFAQNKVGISEVSMTTAKGDQPAFEFFVPDTDAKTVLDAWNKFHKNLKTKPKQDKVQKNYYFSDNAALNELSENTIDIYTRIYETNNGVRFTCAFDLGGVFISSDKTQDKYNKTKLILNKFYAQMAMDAIILEIENELAELEKIKQEYDEIEQSISDFEKEVVVYEDEIKSQEEDEATVNKELEAKNSAISSKTAELKAQQAALDAVNKEAMVAELSTNTNSLKKTDLEITKIEKDIERKEAEIATIQADIDILKNTQEDKIAKKATLTVKIKEIEDRLEAAKIIEKEENILLLEQNIEAISDEQNELDLKKRNIEKVLANQKNKLEKAKKAIDVSKETKSLLKNKLEKQEAKLKELEDLKATIE